MACLCFCLPFFGYQHPGCLEVTLAVVSKSRFDAFRFSIGHDEMNDDSFPWGVCNTPVRIIFQWLKLKGRLLCAPELRAGLWQSLP